MLRFAWLLLTLGVWWWLVWQLPDLPLWLMLVPGAGSVMLYLYGWILARTNGLIPFFTAFLWISESFGVWVHGALQGQPPMLVVFLSRTVLIGVLLAAGFFTFANYRMVLSFKLRRGNIDREQLIQPKPTLRDQWAKLRKLLRWFRREKPKPEEISLTLGEGIEMKE